MGADTCDLATQMFAFATALIEQAHELCIQGQSPHISPDGAAALSAALKSAASDVRTLANAIEIVVGSQE